MRPMPLARRSLHEQSAIASSLYTIKNSGPSRGSSAQLHRHDCPRRQYCGRLRRQCIWRRDQPPADLALAADQSSAPWPRRSASTIEMTSLSPGEGHYGCHRDVISLANAQLFVRNESSLDRLRRLCPVEPSLPRQALSTAARAGRQGRDGGRSRSQNRPTARPAGGRGRPSSAGSRPRARGTRCTAAGRSPTPRAGPRAHRRSVAP